MKKVVKIVLKKRKRKLTGKHLEQVRALGKKQAATEALAKNRQPGVNNGNKEGHNQYTHPRGAKLISEAEANFINDIADEDLVLAVGLEPGKATWADVIAKQGIRVAAGGSLSHIQYVKDSTEAKQKGPGFNGSNTLPLTVVVKFRAPGEVEPKLEPKPDKEK